MTERCLLQQVRPMGGATVDILIEEGRITQIAPQIESDGTTTVWDGRNQLLLPGLVNAHAHIDKNLLGHGWHKNQTPEPRRIRDYVDNKRRLRRELNLSARTQSVREVRAALAAGVTHIHLHEPGTLGAFAVELIAERTKALGLQGRVTVSHVFCLGMIDDAYLNRLIDLLLENRINIMSLGSGVSEFPPLKRLHEAGVTLCTGSDGVRDTWGPYNSIDMLDRVKFLGYRGGLRKDEEVEFLLDMATHGGAKVMGAMDYGLAVGCRADLVVVPGDTPTEAVINLPPRTYVFKAGRLVAGGADVNLADGSGVTPLAHAHQRGFTEIIDILEEAGAQ